MTFQNRRHVTMSFLPYSEDDVLIFTLKSICFRPVRHHDVMVKSPLTSRLIQSNWYLLSAVLIEKIGLLEKKKTKLSDF